MYHSYIPLYSQCWYAMPPIPAPSSVIPAQAGIQTVDVNLDSRLRGNDEIEDEL